MLLITFLQHLVLRFEEYGLSLSLQTHTSIISILIFFVNFWLNSGLIWSLNSIILVSFVVYFFYCHWLSNWRLFKERVSPRLLFQSWYGRLIGLILGGHGQLLVHKRCITSLSMVWRLCATRVVVMLLLLMYLCWYIFIIC